ncbi:MAG TPA: MFS transporter [Paraburkholderia sp.]|jgi:DHA2 family methylenomycin A resistance protein-like MFS transporter|uniref:MFS transporter n=1 Tax=Paraburkholderia sp. TaxID=1926495 RepID=UPI002DF299DF|nr:MFS transporter [Paraburkholderia sp.]
MQTSSTVSASPRAGFVQVAACLGFVVVSIDVSVVNVALDALRAAFHADITGLQWVVNAYALVFASALLLAGALGDRFGAKRVFVAGYALFTCASTGCGLAPSLAALIGWRVVQGLGAALLVPNSLSVLREAFHEPLARGRAVGWWAAGGGIALAAGPVIGGLLIAAFGWRSIFLINVPVGVIGLWMTMRHAPYSRGHAGRSLDPLGQASGALTLAALAFALTEASSLSWQNPLIWGAVLLSVASGAAFVWLQARNPAAMLPPALFANRVVSGTTLIGLIANLVFYGIVFTLSLLFQAVWHFTPERTGLAFLPMMAVLVVMNIAAGRLVHRIGARTLTMLGLLIAIAGYLSMLTALAAQSYAWLIAPMLLAGAGIALAVPTLTNALLAAVRREQSGIASGLLNAARQVGGVMGVALFGFLVRHTQPVPFMHGLAQALVVSATLLAVAAGIAWRTLEAHAGHPAPCGPGSAPLH